MRRSRSTSGVRQHRVWHIILDLAVCMAIATVISVGNFHVDDTADSLIPVFVSLWHWTPFYWEQDRLGMLVPLLAMPISDPLWNLIFQSWIVSFSGCVGILLVGRWLVEDRQTGRLVGALGILLLMTAPPHLRRYFFDTGQSYALSLLLLSLSVLIARSASSRMIVLAAVAMLTCAWVNSGTVLLAAILAACLSISATAMDSKSWRRPSKNTQMWLRVFCLATVGCLANSVWQHLAEFRTTWLVVPSLAQWPSLAFGFASEAVSITGKEAGILLVLFLAVASGLLCRNRPGDRTQLSRTIAVVVGAVLYGALMALLFSGRGRYFIVAYLIAAMSIAALLLDTIKTKFGDSGRLYTAAVIPAVVAAVAMTLHHEGWPSSARLRLAVEQAYGDEIKVIEQRRVTHLIGDYWRVWPLSFATAVSRSADSAGGPVWPITHRSSPTRSQWNSRPQATWVVAAFDGDTSVSQYASDYGLVISEQARESGLVTYSVQSR